jgi:hypothetical protein
LFSAKEKRPIFIKPGVAQIVARQTRKNLKHLLAFKNYLVGGEFTDEQDLISKQGLSTK